MTTPRRGLFRFSLRTLFVVVTVLGGWLGYQLNWIRQRRAVITQSNVASGRSDLPAPMRLRIFGESDYTVISIAFYDDRRADVPWQGLTSEEIMRNFAEPLNADENHEVERIRRLFPEARVYGIVAPESERPARP